MHTSVLLEESIDALLLSEGDVVLDGTFGAGGHSRRILERLGEQGVLIALDTDSDALKKGEESLSSFIKERGTTVHFVHTNFREIDTVLEECGVQKIDACLFDLGFSSTQLQESGRGLSFQKDEPLLMTLTNEVDSGTLTAKRIVNEWSEVQIETILRGYGEEQFSKRIARAIAVAREEQEIETTKELVAIIENAVPGWYRHRRLHPATKTFQALRIAVNDEIEAITQALEKTYELLSTDGRIAVITFHSIEDRAVKRLFQKWEKEEKGKRVPKKAVTPTQEEVQENPRARSAKLRTFQKEQ